ncbi:DcrB-related protein [Serratia sp. N21D137]|uniref:DcrB-related protein n=1 Tax=Serratia sp. N21D137 TaxID=3397495 RepID=UPI0039E0A1BF
MSNPNELSLFQFNEGAIKLPTAWKDLSVLVLSAADNDQSGISFTISRDVIPWGMSFSQFAEREISSLSKQLKNYQQINQENGVLDSRDTATSEFSWSSPQGPIHQLMMLLDVTPKVLVFTATIPGDMTDEQRQQITTLMSTFQLRESATAEKTATK